MGRIFVNLLLRHQLNVYCFLWFRSAILLFMLLWSCALFISILRDFLHICFDFDLVWLGRGVSASSFWIFACIVVGLLVSSSAFASSLWMNRTRLVSQFSKAWSFCLVCIRFWFDRSGERTYVIRLVSSYFICTAFLSGNGCFSLLSLWDIVECLWVWVMKFFFCLLF